MLCLQGVFGLRYIYWCPHDQNLHPVPNNHDLYSTRMSVLLELTQWAPTPSLRQQDYPATAQHHLHRYAWYSQNRPLNERLSNFPPKD